MKLIEFKDITDSIIWVNPEAINAICIPNSFSTSSQAKVIISPIISPVTIEEAHRLLDLLKENE